VNPDCQDVRELMDSYLSEELSVETNHHVLRHLGTCQACSSELTRRQRVRSLLAQSLDSSLDVDGARQRVLNAVEREQRSWGRAARWLGAAAAALFAAIAVATWVARPVDAAAYDDSAGDHVECALAYPEGATYDAARVARNLAAPFERIADAIGLSHGAYHVIDAHMCPYKGRNYAHVVLRGQGQTLSLFAEPALRGSLPSTSARTALGGDTLDVFSTTTMGFRVSAVATSEHHVFLVSDQQTDPPENGTAILLSVVRYVRELEK
jgi:anti-sigma factor RsiW